MQKSIARHIAVSRVRVSQDVIRHCTPQNQYYKAAKVTKNCSSLAPIVLQCSRSRAQFSKLLKMTLGKSYEMLRSVSKLNLRKYLENLRNY